MGKLENDVLYDIDAIDNTERAMQKVSFFFLFVFAFFVCPIFIFLFLYRFVRNYTKHEIGSQDRYAIR